MKPVEIIEAKRKHLARLANQRGADGEIGAVEAMGNWIPRPRGKSLKVLLTALHESGVKIKASSFDAIALPDIELLDFTNTSAVQAALPSMVFIEIKTANQKRVSADFSGFFFAVTENVITAAEALGMRHRIALYNRLTGNLLITSIPELIARAKSTNWQLSIQL